MKLSLTAEQIVPLLRFEHAGGTGLSHFDLTVVERRIAAGLHHRKEPLLGVIPRHTWQNPGGPTYIIHARGIELLKSYREKADAR